MAASVLLIGTTGHIGGTVLDELTKKYSELPVVALVRSEKDKASLSRRYDGVQVDMGSLDDASLMWELASRATIVINCAPDATAYGAAGIQALLDGQLSQRKQCYYIATSGAAIIWDQPTGNLNERIWDDVADVDEILSQPDTVTHALTDRIVTSANTGPLRTAIISPCYVTGLGPSTKHPFPLVFPDWLHVLKTVGCGVVVGQGTCLTNLIEVHELARLYLRLVGDALVGLKRNGSPNVVIDEEAVPAWGPKAFYFPMGVEMSVRSLVEHHLLPSLMKHDPTFLKSLEIKQVTLGKITEAITKRLGGSIDSEIWSGHIAQSFAVNMRIKGTRAEKALGFTWNQNDAGIDKAVGAFLSSRS